MVRTYHYYGNYSERVADVCSGVEIESLSNPSSPTYADLNFITAGYADGESLDGRDNTLPLLVWSAIDDDTGTLISVYQGGVLKTADRLPFVVKSAAPTYGIFIYGVPRRQCNYTRIVVFSKPDGEDVVISREKVKVTQ